MQNEEGKFKPGKIGAGKMLAWQTRTISTGANLMVIGYLSMYCTDTLMMPIALVGALLMASKVVDAITDSFAGFLVDRTKTKLGQARPYELCIIGMWICTVLLFACPPSFSVVAKSVWVVSMYIMVNAVFVTLLNANSTVHMVRAFKRPEQYTSLQTYGSIITMLGVLIFNVIFPMAMGRLATSPQGWTTLILIFAVPLAALGMLRFIFIKEVNENAEVKAISGEKVVWRDVLEVLKKNKYIWFIAILILVYNIITNMGIDTYYYQHIVKNMDIFGLVQLGTLFILPVFFAMPALMRKIASGRVIMLGLILSASGFLLNYFSYTNFPMLMIANILRGIGNVPINMLLPLLIIDNAEYNEFNGNRRLEGTMSALTGFTAKVGSSLGVFMVGVFMSASGYNGEAAQVGDSAILMIRLLFSLIPVAFYIVLAFVMFFYNLDKKMPDIRKRNSEMRAEASAT
ncbi:MAG: MFS transporter [Clostridiales bacterium]|nr:MFS transporter [Clostridiales bacterium]